MKKIGFWSAIALVIGNMIGSGVFLLPTTLAPYGKYAYLAWTFAAIGAVLLALVFGELANLAPKAKAGPYGYSKMGLGRFPGFLVAWGYWISIWCTNAAIAVALVGYLEVFFPILGSDKLASISVGLFAIWSLTYLNTKSIQAVAFFQIITTVLKLSPVLLLGVVGIFYFKGEHTLYEPEIVGTSWRLITDATCLTFFAFLGMESASVASNQTHNAKSTVKKATIWGTLITGLAYLLSYVVIAQSIPPEELIHSTAPFADTAGALWGETARYIVAGGAVIATLGALNGWLLIQGQVPLAAAQDKLFPKIFEKTNKHTAPYIGMILSSLLVSGLMLLNYSKSLVQAFTFMMKLSTLSVLTPYLFSSAVLALLAYRKNLKNKKRIISLSCAAFIFSIWMVIGSGQEIVFWGFLLLMVGLPVYIYLEKDNDYE